MADTDVVSLFEYTILNALDLFMSIAPGFI